MTTTTMQAMKQIDKDQAIQQKYRALTNPYFLPREKTMLDNVVADMQRGNVDAVLVPDRGGIEVWRRAPKSR